MPLMPLFKLDEAAGIYKIDIINMNTLANDNLRQHIRNQGVEIVPGT